MGSSVVGMAVPLGRGVAEGRGEAMLGRGVALGRREVVDSWPLVCEISDMPTG